MRTAVWLYSEWATEGAVQSKSVTSCAGMTVHFVLLAQTKVGFLSGGRSKRMKELPQKEVLAQLEEAYAGATVALTRAQKLCIIMGPLDMRGLLGAATVIGCLKYGAGVCGVHDDNPSGEVFLKERSLEAGPDDSAFIASLRRSLNTPRGAHPPVAMAEIYCEDKHPVTKIRRLLGLSLSMGWMILTGQVTCFGRAGHFWLVDPWSGRFFVSCYCKLPCTHWIGTFLRCVCPEPYATTQSWCSWCLTAWTL